MRELVRTNDIVLVSAVGALLDGANIHHLVLDQNMSVIEGSLGMLPRRILVRAIKGGRAPTKILAALMLNDESGLPNKRVQEILAGKGILPLADR